MDDTMTIRKIM